MAGWYGNGRYWLLALSASLPAGFVISWASVLDISLQPLHTTQQTNGYAVSVYALSARYVLALTVRDLESSFHWQNKTKKHQQMKVAVEEEEETKTTTMTTTTIIPITSTKRQRKREMKTKHA